MLDLMDIPFMQITIKQLQKAINKNISLIGELRKVLKNNELHKTLPPRVWSLMNINENYSAHKFMIQQQLANKQSF